MYVLKYVLTEICIYCYQLLEYVFILYLLIIGNYMINYQLLISHIQGTLVMVMVMQHVIVATCWMLNVNVELLNDGTIVK